MIEFKGVTLCHAKKDLREELKNLVEKEEKRNTAIKKKGTMLLFVCVFCKQSGNSTGGLMNIPETHGGLPFRYGKHSSRTMRKNGLKVHKACLDKNMSDKHKSRIAASETIAG